MKRFAFLALIGAAFLTGCATTGSSSSYVDPHVTTDDARVLAADAVKHLSRPLPPAKTTIVLTASSKDADVLAPALAEQLRAAGYGVEQPTDNKTASPDAVALRYLVSPMDTGVSMRLQYQGAEAGWFYRRGKDGALVSPVKLTVRSPNQERKP